MRIKRLVGELVALLVVPSFWAVPAFAGPTEYWLTTLHTNKDDSFDVVEEIRQDFGNEQLHSFERVLPEVYSTRSGVDLHTKILVQGVEDETGEAVPYEAIHAGNDLKLRIGSSHQTITGGHVYKIHYIARRALSFVNGQPEIYWSAVGREWPNPITEARIILMTPTGADLTHVTANAWIGPLGSTKKVDPLVVSDGVVATGMNLAKGDDLTMSVRLPGGPFAQSDSLRDLMYFWEDWWPAFLVPAVAGACMWLLWWAGGRDQDGGKPIPVEWNPPNQLTPAEVGTLVDEYCDMKDVVAILSDLAIRGFIKIKATTTQGDNKDYLFTKLPAPSSQPLSEYERLFMAGLFGTADDGTTVRLSNLNQYFYLQLAGIKKAVYRSLTNKQLFQQSPDEVRSTWMVFGAMAMFLSPALMLNAHVPSGVGLLLAGVIVASTAKAMPAKTAAGSKAARECLGVANFIKTAGKDQLRDLVKEDGKIFGRLLPYTLILGAAEQWAEAFNEIMTQRPDWYEPAGVEEPGYVFSCSAFVQDLGAMLQTVQQAFSAAPAASADGASGFSGGGFGGGRW